jgi:cytochrome c-type biogenesis protein CcmH
MKKIIWATCLFLITIAAATVQAEVKDETALDVQVREIAKTLRCTVCQNESIWDSKAELAHEMRDVIRERLIQGQTRDEIMAYFLGRYGDYILLEPRKAGVNWLLWAGPFVLLIVGGSLLYRVLRRWVAQTPAPEDLPAIDDAHRRRIEEELRTHK